MRADRRAGRRRLAVGAVVLSLLTVLVVVISIPRVAVGAPVSGSSGDLPSVAARPLGVPSGTQVEASPPVPVPVWPSASEVSVDLAGLSAGRLADAGSAVSVGPPPSGVVGPLQASTLHSVRLGGTPDAGAPAGAPVDGVDVRVLDRSVIAAAGGLGLGVVVNRADGSSDVGPVRISIDVSGFAQAFGAEFFGRLRLVELPACALSTPALPGCQSLTYVDAVADRASLTISGVVDADPDTAAAATVAGAGVLAADGAVLASTGDVVTLTADSQSDAGSFAATDLRASDWWSASPGSGAFDYSIPLTLPPPAEGTAPGLSLDYNSQSVDGLTSATNNQASTVGLGWALTSAYVERRFRSCTEDGEASGEGDLCWYSPYQGTGSGHAADSIFDIVLDGVASDLVPDPDTAGLFHLADDPGWFVMEHTGASNGDEAGVWWRVRTPDGSTYDFGLDADAKTGAVTNSVLTEPVFGNDTGEPCHASWPSSPCTQAYRWMLDRVWDPNLVVTSYHYSLETNSYRSLLGTDESRSYVAAADLSEIDYGWASALSGTNYTDKVVLAYHGRCSTEVAETDPLRHGTTITGSCPSITADPSDYPDVPADEICTDATGDASGCASPLTSLSPVFFSTKMLYTITTYTLTTTGTASKVMVYQLRHALPEPAGVVGKFLWLDYVQREAFADGASPIILPVISFDGTDFDNAVGTTDLEFRRITTLENDLGAVVRVSYGLPDACSTTSLPAEADNHKDCYKQRWTPSGGSLTTGWFNKYMVTEVDVDPNVGVGAAHDGDPIQATTYTYAHAAAAWRYPADPAVARSDQSWTEWQGYSPVTITHDAGTAQANSSAYWIFQGLNGDRKVLVPTGPSDYKSVTVTGSATGPVISFADQRWLAGQVYEQTNRSDTSATQQYIVNQYGFLEDMAVYDGLYDAYMSRPTATLTYSKISTSTSDISTWRQAETEQFYDTGQPATALFGLPVASQDDGQIGVSDNSCTTLGYAVNATASHWVALVDEQAHYGDNCSAASAANQDGDVQTLYDGASSLAGNSPTVGNPTRITTATGPATTVTSTATYDAGGRITTATDANGNTATTSYSPAVGWPTGGVTVTTPAPDPSGTTGSATGLSSTTVSEPAFGQPLTVTDPNSNVSTAHYDAAGRLVAAWTPAQPLTSPATTTVTYTIPTTASPVPDLVNGPPEIAIAVLAGSAYVTGYQYLDGLGRLRESQAPAADGSAGRQVAVTRYDGAGNTTGTSASFYNSSAPGTAMVNPAVASLPSYTALTIDWAGRTTASQIQHLGAGITAGHTTAVYWPDQTATTDADGNATTTDLDVFGRTTSIVQATPGMAPTTVTTSYTYDPKGELTGVTDNASNHTAYAYDWAGRKTETVDPDAGHSCAYYDGDGNTIDTIASAPTPCPTNPTTNSTRISTVYDAVNRPTAVWQGTPGTGTRLDTYTYDTATRGKGLAATATAYQASNAYTTSIDGYDSDGDSLGTTITIPAASGILAGSYDSTNTYDSTGRLTAVGYPAVGSGDAALPAETVTIGYDSLSQPNTLSSALAAYVSATTYANYGPLTGRTYGTGAITAQRGYTWDPATGWLTGITTTVTGGIGQIQNDVHGHDNNGNLTETADTLTGQQQCFAYDELNRLTAAYTTLAAAVPATAVASCGATAPNHSGGADPYDLAYTYDNQGLGNIAGITDNISAITAAYSYTSSQPHAVTAVSHTVGSSDSYGYNNDGNMTTRTIDGVSTTIGWTAQQQAATITTGSASTGYLYDATGNLLLRTDSSGPDTLYLPGEELNALGTIVTPTRYYSLGGATVAMRVGGSGDGTLNWLAADNQDSAQLAISATDGSHTRQNYLPFGGQRGSQGPPAGSQNGYLNQPYDPTTGLIQDGARLYDPTLARFISPDPLVAPGDPQDLNAYTYAGNNPQTASDPSGLRLTWDSEANGGCTPSLCASPASTPLPTPSPSPSPGSQGLAATPTASPTPTATDSGEEATAEQYAAFCSSVGWTVCDKIASAEGSTLFSQMSGLLIVGSALLDLALVAAPELEPEALELEGDLLADESVSLDEADAETAELDAEIADGELQGVTQDDVEEYNDIMSGACRNSFTPDTPVLLADGTTEPIADIKVGDQVEATDPTTGQTQAEPVTQLHDNHDTDLTDLTVQTPHGTAIIHTTQSHLFWNQTTRQWTPAGQLTPGTALHTDEGTAVTVLSVHNWTGLQDMRNLTTNQLHTYYVMARATPVLVHNDTPGCKPGMTIQGGPAEDPPPSQQIASTGQQTSPHALDPSELPFPTTAGGKIKYVLYQLARLFHTDIGG